MTMHDAVLASPSGTPPRGVPVTNTPLARFCRAIPGLFLALALFDLLFSDASRLLNDPDSQWHVAVGRWIWAHGRVPTTDVFSHTFDGAPWIAKEWLSQLIFYGVHRCAGWWGVVVLAGACVALAFVVLQDWLLRRLRPAAAITATLIAVLLCTVHFMARPHILVLPIIVVWMIAIVSAADARRAPPLALALLMVAWANMHGSFPLGLALAGLLAGEGVLLRPAGDRIRAVRDWGLFLALAGAATMVSPYGWQAIVVPLKIGSAETLRYIEEWKPLSLDLQGCVALAVLVAVPLLMARDLRREAFRILAVGLIGYMMVLHVRFISLFGIISAVLVTRVLAARWSMACQEKWQPPVFLVGLLVPAILAVLVLAVTMRPVPGAKVAPDAAFHAALAHGVSGPVYNDYNFGGYLIAAGVKTFIDGRTDQLFLGKFLPSLQAALDSADDKAFAAILMRYHVRWALVRSGSRDATHLARMPGWTKLHQDDVAAAYVAEKYRRPALEDGAAFRH